MIRVVHPGSQIPDPDPYFFTHAESWIPDPGVKKAPGPRSRIPNPGSQIPDPDQQHCAHREVSDSEEIQYRAFFRQKIL